MRSDGPIDQRSEEEEEEEKEAGGGGEASAEVLEDGHVGEELESGRETDEVAGVAAEQVAFPVPRCAFT